MFVVNVIFVIEIAFHAAKINNKSEKCKKKRIYFVVYALICTFAAVKANRKRNIASWMLLAVFVPMLILSSLHIHGYEQAGDEQCTECVHHQCGGHLGQQTLSLHDCLMCQFLTLSITLATCISAVTLFIHIYKLTFAQSYGHLCSQALGATVTRGPPAYLL